MKKLLSILLALAVTLTMPAGAGLQFAYAGTEGTAISTADDLKAIEKNPSGKYYLANDIQVPANLILFANDKKPFTGTLDGNGHKLNGYEYETLGFSQNVALFKNAEGATFKNLTMSNVNINLSDGGSAYGIVARSKNCSYINVKTSGTIKIKNRDIEDYDECDAAGFVGSDSGAVTLTNCTNGINIEITHIGQSAPVVSGLINRATKGTITGCTNKGNITVTHTPSKDWGSDECAVAGIAANYLGSAAVKNCKNSGNLSIVGKKATAAYNFVPKIAGIVVYSKSNFVSCTNSGKLTVTNNAKGNYGVCVSGVVCEISGQKSSVSKCSNSGAISYTGVPTYSAGSIVLAGVAGNVNKIDQSYNKGAISVKSKVKANAGGVVGFCADMRNCYNTGTISHKGTGFEGGIAAEADVLNGYVKNNYSTGKATGSSSKKLFRGQLIGYYGGGYDVMKRNIFDNYYKTSGKPYGGANFDWKPWLATAKKVSSINAKSCTKLSSKVWTYSSKYKRLILKNNKER